MIELDDGLRKSYIKYLFHNKTKTKERLMISYNENNMLFAVVFSYYAMYF